ncbi:MAG: hypothetical protein JXC32_04705 [Anaerolineae bacterium]|nr:hypothetical protein [Anaerolineae bacterium]
MDTVKDYLEFLVEETEKSEDEVIAQAIRSGLRQMWREQILADYVNGKLTREAAVQAVGLDWVELAERQQAAVLEDLEWALDR